MRSSGMKRLATALLALATLTLGAAPLAAHAADKPAFSKDQLDKGKKDAPGVLQKAGLACTVADAGYLGSATGKDGKIDVYEVACQQGMGYVVQVGKETKAYDCLAVSTQPAQACKLPENADPAQGLKPILATAGTSCTPTKARWVGANATNSVYEVACQEGPGYILQTAAVGAAATPPTVIPCIQTEGRGNMECTLTPKTQSDAYLAGLVAKSGKACQISGTRYMGSDKTSGAAYYEVGCGSQAGFVVAANKAGALDRVVTCGEAAALGGCTMTDATKVATEESATYTRLAKAGGFNCDVSKYRPIGIDSSKNEIVELACSNRPDGVVAMFPDVATGKAQFVDCVTAGKFGPNGACKLSSKAPILAKYTAALAAKGKSSCKVSDARFLGVSASGSQYIEAACADGAPGWVMELTPSDQLVSVLNCAQAKSSGLSCQLPTNAKG